MDIKFHSDEKGNFPDQYMVRAFTYFDYSIEMHNHDFYEVNIVLSGSGTHCIENGRFLVKSGDVFVIPPMVAHAYIDTDKLDVYHILLQKRFIAKNWSEAEKVDGFLQLMEIEPFLRSNSGKPVFLHLTQSRLRLLENDLDFIDDKSSYSWNEFSSMKYHAAWKILYWFSGLLNRQIKHMETIKEQKYEALIIRTLEFIHRHYGEKITIDRLCEKVFLSRSTFLRSFQMICEMTPIEYLNEFRCKKAVEMMDTTNCLKTEIAHKCGFYDLSHMERMLKKQRKFIS